MREKKKRNKHLICLKMESLKISKNVVWEIEGFFSTSFFSIRKMKLFSMDLKSNLILYAERSSLKGCNQS